MSSGDQTIQNLLNDKIVFLYMDGDQDRAYQVGPVDTSPCTWACPAGVNVKTYVSLIAAGRFPEALEVVRRNNPLPAICGRICTHPCEAACNRNQIDDPIAICDLKRFLTDYEMAHPPDPPPPAPRTKKQSVAIVGSGPAGLTAAHDLVRMGYGVTVFEALPRAGGMLVAGVPSFRLSREILELEIDLIRALGVDIQTGVTIAGDRAVDGLFQEGHGAVFFAVGAHQSRKLGFPGEESRGIIDCLTFLRGVNFGQPTSSGRKTVVIGGGHSALDSAQTALRLGAQEVTIIYRRSRKEMPAHAADIRGAEDEGVQIHFLVAPRRLLVKQGRVTGIECVRTKLGATDESGRRRPHLVEGSEFVVQADTVITAIGEQPDLSFLPENHGFDLSPRWNTFITDEAILATNRPGIFAGGDVVTGPKTVIDAIAAGHVAARSINRFLEGKSLGREPLWKPPTEVEFKVDLRQRPHLPRRPMPTKAIVERIRDFREINLGFEADEAMEEASRCLRCGPCRECDVCVAECDKQVALLSSGNGDGALLLRSLPALDAARLPAEPSPVHVVGDAGTRVAARIHPLISRVDESRCRGCGDCVKVCEYGAVTIRDGERGLSVAHVDEDRCKGCGTCAADCPSGAMVPGYFTEDWVVQRLGGMTRERTNLVVITCSWGGARLHDFTSHRHGKVADITYLQTLCAGRVEPAMVLRAFEMGADGVLINSCGVQDCHYGFGAARLAENYGRIEKLVTMLGIDSTRLCYKQIQAGEVARFDRALQAFSRQLRKLNSAEPKAGVRAARG